MSSIDKGKGKAKDTDSNLESQPKENTTREVPTLDMTRALATIQAGDKRTSDQRSPQTPEAPPPKEKMTRQETGRMGGKIGGPRTKEMGTGIFGRTPEQRVKDARKGGKIGGKIGGSKTKEMGTGIFGMTPEQRAETSERAGKRAVEERAKKNAPTQDAMNKTAKQMAGGRVYDWMKPPSAPNQSSGSGPASK